MDLSGPLARYTANLTPCPSMCTAQQAINNSAVHQAVPFDVGRAGAERQAAGDGVHNGRPPPTNEHCPRVQGDNQNQNPRADGGCPCPRRPDCSRGRDERITLRTTACYGVFAKASMEGAMAIAAVINQYCNASGQRAIFTKKKKKKKLDSL